MADEKYKLAPGLLRVMMDPDPLFSKGGFESVKKSTEFSALRLTRTLFYITDLNQRVLLLHIAEYPPPPKKNISGHNL